MKNNILLRRRLKFIVPQGTDSQPLPVVATFLKNIEGLGFTFSEALIKRMRTLSDEALAEAYQEMVIILREMTGASRQFFPVYPNFPQQVMDMSEFELYANAMFHYWGKEMGVRILPQYEKEIREPLKDKIQLKRIDLGTEEELIQIMRNVAGAKTSISETDKKDLEWAFMEYAYDRVERFLPDEFINKENLAVIASYLVHYSERAEELILTHFKTATDVLRLITALSKGDVSLATNTKFFKFSRPQRRLLLGMLENCGAITEDMLRYPRKWMRIGELLHPGEYAKQYPKVAEAFDIIRNNKPFATFNSKVEMGLLNGEVDEVAKLLATRPGEFARRLDVMIRRSANPDVVIAQFSKIAGQVSTAVLMQVRKHFTHRGERKDIRVIFPKGEVAKAYGIKDKLPLLGENLRKPIIQICEKALLERFGQKGSLGKVYLDERLKNYIMPFSQRSAAKALRTLVRGSRIPLAEGDTIRFFIWWHEGTINGKTVSWVDIDLSAVMYDTNWKYLEHISYTNLKSAKYKAAHSGDITSAPNGACEFIDLDIPSILKYGGRYVVACIMSYSQEPFCDLPECYGGWMMRQFPNSGEIFDARTVTDKVDVAANTRFCIPVIIDLESREMIWSDLALNSYPSFYPKANNIESNQRGMVAMGKAMTQLLKPSLYDLFILHAKSRGTLVDSPENADTIFSVEKGITPFDLDVIMADYM